MEVQLLPMCEVGSMNTNPDCPKCGRRTWGYAQWCPVDGDIRDLDRREIKEVVRETWAEQEVPKEQLRMAL